MFVLNIHGIVIIIPFCEVRGGGYPEGEKYPRIFVVGVQNILGLRG